MTNVPLFQVDAFTDRPFRGNPAAVCLLNNWPDDTWLQAVASEMNLSETAFVAAESDGFRLRWFTPKAEVDLCGHATLATAHVLWQERWSEPNDTIRFHTRSGVLTAERLGTEIQLDFPLTTPEPVPMPPRLAEALGIKSTEYVGRSRLDILVVLSDEQSVRSLSPDFQALARIETRGVIVTARADRPPFDFVSRFFAPAFGIDEDPVTGSAHCCLGAYWRDQLGKSEFVAFQASPRGGTVRVRVTDSRAFLSGPAVTVLSGQLLS